MNIKIWVLKATVQKLDSSKFFIYAKLINFDFFAAHFCTNLYEIWEKCKESLSNVHNYCGDAIEYQSDDITKNFFAFQCFEYHISVEHDEKNRSRNLVGIGSWGPEIWPHEYLI